MTFPARPDGSDPPEALGSENRFVRRPEPLGSENRFVRRLAHGDPQAWEDLCQMYAEPLFIYAYHRTGKDRYLAEDVRQETLLAAARSIASFRGEVPLFSWLCGIARHKAADEIRKAARQGTPVDMEGFQEDPLDPGATGVEDLESSAALVEVLWSLQTDYRQVLLARYRDGLGVEEIAVRLGRSYKATESLLSRARETLRKHLTEADRDG